MKGFTIFTLLLIFLLPANSGFAQIPSGNPDCLAGDGVIQTEEESGDIYIGGYVADKPLQRVPFISRIDTGGNVVWKRILFFSSRLGELKKFMVLGDYVYVITKHEEYSNGYYNHYFNLIKLNKNTGSNVWAQYFFHSAVNYLNGYQMFNDVKSLFELNSTSLAVMINQSGGGKVVNHIYEVNLSNGNKSLAFIDSSNYGFDDLHTDGNGNYYGIGINKVVKMPVGNPASATWNTTISNMNLGNLRKSRIRWYNGAVYAFTTDPNGKSQVIKFAPSNGAIAWNTIGNTLLNQGIGDYVFSGNGVYVTWNKVTSSGNYWVNAQKVNLGNGSVAWTYQHVLSGSGWTAYGMKIKAANSKVAITGHGTNNMTNQTTRNQYWFHALVNQSSGSEVYFSESKTDPNRYEFYSQGVGIEFAAGQFQWIGNLQEIYQSNQNAPISLPSTRIGLIRLSNSGNEQFRRLIDIGIRPVLKPTLSDTSICMGEDILVLEDYPNTWTFNWKKNGQTFSTSSNPVIVPNQNMTLKVDINGGKCNDQFNWDIMVNQVDTSISVTAGSITSNAMGATYQWIDCITSTELPGETNQTLQVSGNGSFAVIVSENGCSDTSRCVNFGPVGMENEGTPFVLRCFPNPASDWLTLECSENRPLDLSILDVLGNTVKTSIFSGTSKLDLSHLNSGIYVIRIEQNGSLVHQSRLLKN